MSRKKLPRDYAPPIRYWSFAGGLCLVCARGPIRKTYNVGLKVPAQGIDTLIDRPTAARMVREYRAKTRGAA